MGYLYLLCLSDCIRSAVRNFVFSFHGKASTISRAMFFFDFEVFKEQKILLCDNRHRMKTNSIADCATQKIRMDKSSCYSI